jgi:hypothetical protein
MGVVGKIFKGVGDIVGDIVGGIGDIFEETYEFATGLDTKREAEKQAAEIKKQ